MRAYFRRAAIQNQMLPQDVTFKLNGKIKPVNLFDKRKRGGILPATGPLQGCVLGAMPTHKEGYARVIAFSIVSPAETCENSLMISAQTAHVSALELIFELEPGRREKTTSVVIYEA